MWAWLFPAEELPRQQGLQSLPRELSLADDGQLRIKPLRELEKLRYGQQRESDLLVRKLVPYKLARMAGDALEFEVVFAPLQEAYKINPSGYLTGYLEIPRSFGMDVLCDENGENGLRIAINPSQKTLSIGQVAAPFSFATDAEVNLRVFIDNTVIEAFAGDRQAMAYTHARAHPHANNQLFIDQGNMVVKKVTAWKMRSPWEDDSV